MSDGCHVSLEWFFCRSAPPNVVRTKAGARLRLGVTCCVLLRHDQAMELDYASIPGLVCNKILFSVSFNFGF